MTASGSIPRVAGDRRPESVAPRIITHFDPPPIPIRNCDWSAMTENYDLGSPIGHGRTEQEAIDDLLMQMDS